MVEIGSTSVRGSVARSQTPQSHDHVNAGSNSAPDSNECSENAIYQEPLDLGLLKEEDRKKHSSSTALKLLPSVEDTLKTADVRSTELNAKVENQRKGSFFQDVTCIAVGKSGICQESDIGPPIRSHCPSKGPQLVCPECGSGKINKNGTATSNFGVIIQRYICKERGCGCRFSDPEDLKQAKQVADSYLLTVNLKDEGANIESSQVCVLKEEAKNLTLETPEKISVSQGEKQKDTSIERIVKADIDLVIADYKQYIQKEHLVNDLTLSKYVFRLKWLANKIGVDLFDPEDFKRKLAFDPELSTKSNCNKNSICKAYTNFVKKYLHMEDVKIPHFEYKTPEYNLPQTQHMEMLYAALSFQMQVFCFVLMATAARPIEALRIEWKDIDFARKTIAINKPAKHGRTRTIQLKGRFVKVIDMLAELKNRQINIATCRNRKQRNLELVFTYKGTDTAGQNFRRAREAATIRLGIPELGKITFYSNRHWRAVLERYLKGNSDAVANLLGENSDKYVKVYAPISERLYGSDKEWEPIEISETDPDYSEKMSRYGAEGYQEYNYNRMTGRHYLRKEKNVY